MKARHAVAAVLAVATLSGGVLTGTAGAHSQHHHRDHHHRDHYRRQPTIVDLAASNPDLSILVQAVQKAGLVDALSDRRADLTVFAPTNDAFVALLGQLGVASLDDIDVDTLRDVLSDHVLAERYDSTRLARADRKDVRPTALGGLPIDFDRKPASVNDADVVAADLRARNGVVHVIDGVLLEPDPRPTIAELAVGNPDLSILVDAATRAGLVEALSAPGDLTVFAPTNDAFVALLSKLGVASLDDIDVDTLRGVLLDHVVPAELDQVDLVQRSRGWKKTGTLGDLRLRFDRHPLQVNGVDIVATDVEGSNGTVQVIDEVLLDPPSHRR